MLIADMHCDTLLLMYERDCGIRSLKSTFGGTHERAHVDIDALRHAGVGLQCFACFIPPEYEPSTYKSALHSFIDRFDAMVEEEAALFRVRGAADLDEIQTGKTAALLSIEGLHPLESVEDIQAYYARGVRLMTLTWNNSNLFAQGILEDTGEGLTESGFEALSLMQQLGIIVDVAHLNPAGFWDVARTVKKPFIASHSCAKALCRNARNLTDEQIRAVADAGGAIGLNFHLPFLKEQGAVTIEDAVRHIVHIVKVGGIDVAGFGSDFDGIAETPIGLEGSARLPGLLYALSAAGFSDDAVERIACKNMLRVCRACL